MGSGSGILDMITGFLKPAWELATRWEFWVILIAIVAFAFCMFILYPSIIWLIYQAGRLIGLLA